jgi:bifunctional ADP-heptose synthase (sugar kinase/adenylyltransferase)
MAASIVVGKFGAVVVTPSELRLAVENEGRGGVVG